MVYEQTIKIQQDHAEYIRKYAESKDLMGEDDTISKTAKFNNPGKYEMDIKLCGCQDDKPWSDAVLFNKNGAELTFTDVCDGAEFFGDWELEYENDKFIAHVIEEK
jgi:hypothetical protein